MKTIKSFFLVEDDPIMVFGLKKMLNALVDSATISAFANGKLAIDAISSLIKEGKDLPDAIFLDINMPIMDGWQFLEEFKKLDIDKRVKINIVTSSIDANDRMNYEWFKEAMQHDISYNNKPMSKAEISDIIQMMERS